MRYPSLTYFEGNKNFYKQNYVKATEILTPSFYISKDVELGGTDISDISEVINSHLVIAKYFSEVILSGIGGIISVPNSPYENINNISGLNQFFIKQNNLTDIDANDFERNVLLPLGYSLTAFSTSGEFREFLLDDLLPLLHPNIVPLTDPTASPVFSSIDGNALRDNTYNDGTGSINKHSYLINHLSWLYLLNVSGLSYHGSSLVAEALVDTVWKGKNFLINDAIKLLTEYIFRNYSANPTWDDYQFLPRYFRPNLDLQDTTYTSGLQQLDKLKTLIDVIYSTDYGDRGDTKVKEAFDQYIENSILVDDIESQGPFYKFLKAISYAFADYNNSAELLEFLNDPQRCPAQYLPYIANLLGWRLLGSEPQKWRVQLINCVSIYKSVGTTRALQSIVDSVFSQDLFQASSQILEMWESYLPHLAYYALATESPLFKNRFSWTREEADRRQVTYIASSFDESIRCAVDKIILDVANQYSLNFWVRGEELAVSDPNCTFNYRGRDYKVPPFEEYGFYLNQKLDKKIISYFIDLLVCFGVSTTFADSLESFIKNNTIEASGDISRGYSWLFFTETSQYPPNWSEIIKDISNKNIEYLPLWNGKSSHFKIFLDVNDFVFIKDSLLINSIEGLRILNEIIDEFSPAHAIKQLYFRINDSDLMRYANTSLPLIFFNVTDDESLSESDTLGFCNYEISGTNVNSYKRGDTSDYYLIQRDSVDSLTDTYLSGAAISAPRKSFRRRNFENLLNSEGLYTRTGFNMPTTYQGVVEEYSLDSSLGFLPLGLIPSSQSYVLVAGSSITVDLSGTFETWRSIPQIYSICEGLRSNSVYSGLEVSNTFPCRGLSSVNLETDDDYTVDRGNLNAIVNIMHYIGNNTNTVVASAMIDADPSLVTNEPPWKNVLQSLANKLSNESTGFPQSFDDYKNFEFGKDLHKLHRAYCTYFERHPLTKALLNLDGPNIFAHTFGSIYRNSKLETFGTAYTISSNCYVSSLENEYSFVPFGDFFPSAGGGTFGAMRLTNASSLPLTVYDIANSSIYSGIELIHGLANTNDYFIVYDLQGNEVNFPTDQPRRYATKNRLLKLKNYNSTTLPRIKLDLKTYPHSSEEGYPLSSNFLIPEHNFKIQIKALAANDSLTRLGGATIGVFIHTAYEKEGCWVYAPDNTWTFVNQNRLDFRSVKRIYAHKLSIPEVPSSRSLKYANRLCRDTSISGLSLYDLEESDFNLLNLNFNTKNQPISVPEFYYKTYQQVHRKDQNYFIEIFVYSNSDKFVLFDSINVIDSTLNKWSQHLVSAIGNQFAVGDFNKKEYRLDLDKNQIYHIFRYFTELTGSVSQLGLASRIAAMTAAKFEANGGSRLNYRLNPLWLQNTTVNSPTPPFDYDFSLINALYIEN
jgi:hypothetical protein